MTGTNTNLANNVLLIVLAGVPGSGKSFIANDLSYRYGYAVVSSDDIREEMFGDASDQRYGHLVFREAHSRTRGFLLSGEYPGVIFDATNCVRKNRRAILRDVEGCYDISICAVHNVDLDTCLMRNSSRDRYVPEDVIERMYERLYNIYPDVSEGFDYIIDTTDLEALLLELQSS